MNQRNALVAEALVSAEIASGEWGVLTVDTIVFKYALWWGIYANDAERADQLVRRALNKAVHDGRLRRLPYRDGRLVQYGVAA